MKNSISQRLARLRAERTKEFKSKNPSSVLDTGDSPPTGLETQPDKATAKIFNFEIGRKIDTDSAHFSCLVGSSIKQGYPITGILNLRTNTAHLDSDCQTLQDDQFEGFDICEAIEARDFNSESSDAEPKATARPNFNKGRWVSIVRITKKQVWLRDNAPKYDLHAVNLELQNSSTSTFTIEGIS